MYIVKMPKNSVFTTFFKIDLELQEQFQFRYIGSETADEIIIRTFSITTCVCMGHSGL